MNIQEIAPGIASMPVSIANAYFVGEPGGTWFLVDTGTPGKFNDIVKAAAARYGENARPEFIVLTHGHFDHAGSAWDLAEAWHVPIYAHHLEQPYLTGMSPYPPKDPTVGGAMAFLSRFFPVKSLRLQPHLRELPGKRRSSRPSRVGMALHSRPRAGAYFALQQHSSCPASR